MSINKVVVSGNVGAEPELRQAGETKALSFRMCVTDRRRNPQSGEWEDAPNWVHVTLFGSRAEAVSRFVGKGSHVTVSGRLREDRWKTRDGSKRSRVGIVADDIDFTGSRREEPQQQADAYDDWL